MGKFCKNCGAYVDETSQFCPDCGREVNMFSRRYCPNCGDKLVENEYFCKNCGTKLMQPKENFLEKHNAPVIVIVVIAVIALVAFGAFSFMSYGGSQEVQVDTFSFSIPDDYVLASNGEINENNAGIQYVSNYYQNDAGDYIQIVVVYSTTVYVDENNVLEDMGGEKSNMLGYDGYLDVASENYVFSFVKDNKLVSIYTSDMDVYDSIEVL